MRSVCVIIILSLIEVSWGAAPLPAPRPRALKEYNYSNGVTGSNHAGVTSEEAGSINEVHVPLGIPKPKSIEIQNVDAEKSEVSEAQKDD